MRSVALRFDDLGGLARLLEGASDHALPLPAHVEVEDGEWVLAMFELDGSLRATAAAGRGARVHHVPVLVFERRDWERLVDFAAPRPAEVVAEDDEPSPATERRLAGPVPSEGDRTEVQVASTEARIAGLGVVRTGAIGGESAPRIDFRGGQTASYETVPRVAVLAPEPAEPATLREPTNRRDEAAAAAATRAVRVYMVDDDADLGDVVTEMLDSVGLSVRLFSCGEDALAALDDDPPELVLLERVLPSMSGVEVCAALRRHPQFGTVPILFLTSQADSQEVVEAFAVGADDYVTKPFRVSELGARMFGLLRRARIASPSR